MTSWPERFDLIEGGATVTVRLAISNAATQFRAALHRYAPHLKGKLYVKLERETEKPWRGILTLRLLPEKLYPPPDLPSTPPAASTPTVTAKLEEREANPQPKKGQ